MLRISPGCGWNIAVPFWSGRQSIRWRPGDKLSLHASFLMSPRSQWASLSKAWCIPLSCCEILECVFFFLSPQIETGFRSLSFLFQWEFCCHGGFYLFIFSTMQSELWDVSFNPQNIKKKLTFLMVFLSKLGLSWSEALGISRHSTRALAGHILDSPVISIQMAALKNQKPWKKKEKNCHWTESSIILGSRLVLCGTKTQMRRWP